LKRRAKIKKGDEIIGSRIKAKVVKNKVAPPFRETEFDILYDEGISYYGDLLNMGIKDNLVTKSGMTYTFGDIKLGVGFEATRGFLKENPKIGKELLKQITKN
jgi:recombination protein RecA